MVVAAKLYEYRKPDSFTNPQAEAFEFMLHWYGLDGGQYNWLFTDFSQKGNVNFEVVNENTSNISKLFNSNINTYNVACEDLTENQFDVISKIMYSKDVYRTFKDGTFIKLAVLSKTFEKRKSDNRYNLSIEVQYESTKTLN